MNYILKSAEGSYSKDKDSLNKLIVYDCDVRGDNDEPAFSFSGDIGEELCDKYFHFNIDLKDAIYLRNALNSFIEIQNIK